MPRRTMAALAAVSLVAPLAGAAFARQSGAPASQAFDPDRATPHDIAVVLARRYPESPIMSYIPAVAWSASLRLARLTGNNEWRDKPRQDMSAFLSGAKPAIAQPYQLTSLAGHLGLADLGAEEGVAAASLLAAKAAAFVLAESTEDMVKFRRNWTDDMFMASTLLARVAGSDPALGDRMAAAVGRLLTTYAATLQRSDGIFVHAKEGPHAWGRGNGFALLGVTEALSHLPAGWSDRSGVLAIYRRHVAALIPLQSEDGSWRQVVDEPTSYRELTVTAMITAAMARGVRLRWLDESVRPVIEKGWRAVAARVHRDGTVRDVCAGTGAGATKDYYLNRPIVNGADDRGGAMALLAAVEMLELSRAKVP